QLALRSIQERERLNEQMMDAQLQGLRNDLAASQQQGADAALLAQRQAELQQRQAELEQLRKQRETDAARLTQIQQQHAAAIADATRKRNGCGWRASSRSSRRRGATSADSSSHSPEASSSIPARPR